MFDRIPGAMALAASLLLSIAARRHDESKYPNWGGMWRRPPASASKWDETGPWPRPAAPLKPEFQKVLEDSIVEKAGGQGGDFRVRAFPTACRG